MHLGTKLIRNPTQTVFSKTTAWHTWPRPYQIPSLSSSQWTSRGHSTHLDISSSQRFSTIFSKHMHSSILKLNTAKVWILSLASCSLFSLTRKTVSMHWCGLQKYSIWAICTRENCQNWNYFSINSIDWLRYNCQPFTSISKTSRLTREYLPVLGLSLNSPIVSKSVTNITKGVIRAGSLAIICSSFGIISSAVGGRRCSKCPYTS